jgi:hypothetical protein
MTEEAKFAYMACAEYEPLLEEYLSGGLCDANVAAVARHLEGCLKCRRAADAALAGTRMVREMSEIENEVVGMRVQPSPAFARIVMARIRAVEAEQQAEHEGYWRTLIALGRKFAVIATMAVAMLAVYEARLGAQSPQAPQPNVASARPSEVREMFAPDPVNLPTDEGEALVMVTEMEHADN